MIDICDFAVGLSRQLYGLTIATERPGHRMMETWHPLGVVGVISAFNFPVAVWSWNAALALVCGDTVVWKPSEKTPLTALACRRCSSGRWRVRRARRTSPGAARRPREVGEALVDDPGRAGQRHRLDPHGPRGRPAGGRPLRPRAARARRQQRRHRRALGRPRPAVRGIVFAAAGTAGQRCTTLRRLIVHDSVYDELVERG
jgi:aldehyde dehydrogenase (NAD+)